MEDPFAHVAMQHALDIVMVLDAHHNCLYANPAARRILGHAEGELAGHNILDILDEPTGQALLDTWSEALTAPYSGIVATLRLPAADGTPVPMEISLRMAPADAARQAMFVLVARPAEPGSVQRMPRWRHAPVRHAPTVF